MTAVRVHLRYRPASDVLSGDIELRTIDADGTGPVAGDLDAGAHAIAESPDADSHLEWHRSELDDAEYLSAFQIVHAAARLEAGTLPALPESLVPLVSELVQSGQRSLAGSTSSLARMQAKSEVVVQLPRQQLLRPAAAMLTVPASWSVDRTQVAAANESLRRLATVLRRLAPSEPDLEGARTEQLGRLLLELASVLTHTQGTPSPGTTAAARRAVRGGIPLAASERLRLRAALAQLDNTTSWPAALSELDALSRTLEQASEPPAHGEAPPR